MYAPLRQLLCGDFVNSLERLRIMGVSIKRITLVLIQRPGKTPRKGQEHFLIVERS